MRTCEPALQSIQLAAMRLRVYGREPPHNFLVPATGQKDAHRQFFYLDSGLELGYLRLGHAPQESCADSLPRDLAIRGLGALGSLKKILCLLLGELRQVSGGTEVSTQSLLDVEAVPTFE